MAVEKKDTRAKAGWGGKRAGAGRKPRGWKIVPHRKRYAPKPDAKIVWRLVRDLRRHRRLVERLLQRLAERFEDDLVGDPRYLGGNIVLVLDAIDPVEIATVLQRFGVRLAKGINAILGRAGPVFVERYRMLSPPYVPPPVPPLRERLKAAAKQEAENLLIALLMGTGIALGGAVDRRRGF